MNNTRFGLIFYFKKPKRHTGTTLPVYMRISMDNQRAEMSTQRKWDPTRWSAEAGRAISAASPRR